MQDILHEASRNYSFLIWPLMKNFSIDLNVGNVIMAIIHCLNTNEPEARGYVTDSAYSSPIRT